VRCGFLLEQALAPVPGGTGRYAVELAAALARTAQHDDSVSGWTAWHRDVTPASVAGVGGPVRLALPRRVLTEAWARARGPAPKGMDVLHAPTLLFPPRRRTPLVVTIHDVVPWTHPETLTARGARWHRDMAVRAARQADAITVPTQAVAAQLHQVLNIAPERVRVTGAGVARALEMEPAEAFADKVAARLDLPREFVLTLATVEPRKGLDVLVEAIRQLGAAAPRLVVVGPAGWGGVDVAAMARRAGLADDQVRVLGRLPDDDLAVVLRRAVVLAVPSRAEGFGLPVAEAMTVGTAVVCTDEPALTEVAGGAARVVPIGDPAALATAIGGLVADPARRSTLVRRGFERAAAFRWDDVATRTWAVYHQVVGRGPACDDLAEIKPGEDGGRPSSSSTRG
jgi:glycosyltransferase involved in cell wall biosynthesis